MQSTPIQARDLPGMALSAKAWIPFLALIALLLAACQPRNPERPDILLVSIDTLRPDALGAIDPRRDTPSIDALAASGRLFSAAISPVPLTLPSHTSILSGRLPVHHGVHDNGQAVPGGLTVLPEILRANGYRTGAFVSGFPLQAMFGLDRGFDSYDDHMPDGTEGWVERRAEDTVAAARAWLEQERSKPAFTWVHFYDPHDPYTPPREFWQPGPRGDYDGEVTYVDYWLGKLLDSARARAGERSLLVILTADHGEALGEHEEKTHGYFVYDSTLHVPLIVAWPGHVVAGAGAEPVQLVDITPTVLDLLGLEALEGIDGVSLRAGLEGGAVPLHPAVSETWLPWTYYGWAPLTAVREGQWKLIDAPTPELYDLATDAPERQDRHADSVAVADRLGLMLADLTRTRGPLAATVEDDAAMQKLRSLGYVGVGARVEAPTGDLPDPKSRIAMRNALQEGEGLLRAGRFADADAVFAQVLATDPDNRFALLRRGIALLRQGRFEIAEEALAHAVRVEPQRAEARYAYADVLMRRQNFAAAAEQWAALAELQPRRKEAWFNLAAALDAAGEKERAKAARETFERLAAEEATTQGKARP